MNNGKAGVALFITVVALICFSIFAFYGMEYLFEGNHWLTISLWLCGFAVLSVSLWFMCKSKAYRSKRSGLPIEISSIIIAIIVLFVGSIPFTMFVSVLNHKKEFTSSITETAHNIATIDSCYQAYTNQRLADYESYLRHNRYRSADIPSKINSLRRRLTPENVDSISHERQEWLKSLDSVNIWNVSTARNFHYIILAGEDWCEQYRQRSSLFYEGEDTTLFDLDQSVIASQSSYRKLRTPHSPDGISLVATMACIFLILTSYFYIRRPRNRYSGHHR